jgi:hypothetical protein
LIRDYPGHSESWLANEYMRKFISWFHIQIYQTDTPTSEYLKKLSHSHIFTVVTYQRYDINEYMFYTKQQDKKNTYPNSGVRVDDYDVIDKDKNMYYDQIHEICELDANQSVVKDKYEIISIDLNRQDYKSEPFMLAKHVAQGFYVPDTTNKKCKVVIPRK